MTNFARILRYAVALTAAVSVALIAACETTPPAPATTVVVPMTPPVPERPWTVDELTYHPCAVLAAEDTARFILEPDGEPATPPNALSACSWQSVQTSPAGRFSVRFTTSTSGPGDPSRRGNQDSADQQVTVGGNRAVVRTGVAWDTCPQAVDIASVIAVKLH